MKSDCTPISPHKATPSPFTINHSHAHTHAQTLLSSFPVITVDIHTVFWICFTFLTVKPCISTETEPAWCHSHRAVLKPSWLPLFTDMLFYCSRFAHVFRYGGIFLNEKSENEIWFKNLFQTSFQQYGIWGIFIKSTATVTGSVYLNNFWNIQKTDIYTNQQRVRSPLVCSEACCLRRSSGAVRNPLMMPSHVWKYSHHCSTNLHWESKRKTQKLTRRSAILIYIRSVQETRETHIPSGNLEHVTTGIGKEQRMKMKW